VGAVAQFVVAVREAALQLVEGRTCGVAQSLESLGLAEQLAHGVIGKGQVGGGVAGLGQTAQGIALEAGDLAGAGVAAASLDDVGELACGVVDVALPAAAWFSLSRAMRRPARSSSLFQ
jgi:hypothetical protein